METEAGTETTADGAASLDGEQSNGAAQRAGVGAELGEGGKKALEAERAAVKDLKSQLAQRDARLKEFEDRDKSDEQKRTEELQQAQQEISRLALELAKREAAVKHHLGAEDLDLIGGSTPEEIEERAAKLSARINQQAGHDPNLGRETTPQGASGDWLRDKLTSN